MLNFQRYILILVSILIVYSSLPAQDETPFHSPDGEYIREWLILGPFYTSDLDKDLLNIEGGESAAEPEAGDSVITEDGNVLVWQYFKGSRKIVDLSQAVGQNQDAVAYAYCKLWSDMDLTCRILLGSDDGAAVWINNKPVHYNDTARQLFLDNDSFDADLQKGLNNCLIKVSQKEMDWGFSMRAVPEGYPVNTEPKFYISPKKIKKGIYLQNSMWKFHAGDNIDWADPEFDDAGWQNINPELKPYDLSSVSWPGTGWFRINAVADSALIDKPVGLSVWQAGTSQLYIDGKLIHTFNDPNEDINTPAVIAFENEGEHLIAVRYSVDSLEKFHSIGWPAGFYMWVADMNQLTAERILNERPLISYQIFFTTLSLTIGLLHFILFIFSPGSKQNLYFALFLFFYAAAIYFDYQQLLAADMSQSLFSLQIHRALWPLLLLLKLRFFYSLFYRDLSKQIWQFSIISVAAIAMSALAIFYLPLNLELIDLIVMAIVVEISRVIVMAMASKKEGAWIAGLAFLVFFVFLLFDYMIDAGVVTPLTGMRNPYALGIVAFYLAMSVYLSRDYARTNKRLAEQEIEQKLLEADNKRQAKELEEARQLQLSMLPKKLPGHPRFEIGVYMKTATEVGGDYYDFKLHDDGILTVVIGDATGHGMQAGIMVSAAKSLFHTLADERSPDRFLKKGSLVIKSMGLKKMFMAMSIVKLKKDEMEISAAGMPFPLIFRSSTGIIEEVEVKGMPLGGNTSFPYYTEKARLEPGDTILLASDGFEELFNQQNEMLGTDRVKMIFKETASKNPDQIIEHLEEAGNEWKAGREQEDDITFVVIKVKNN